MAENTLIEWATNTFNPWIGCTKVSDGCKHCYAETQDNHRKWTPDGWGKGKPRKRTSAAYWKQPYAWDRKAEKEGTSPRVFCASLADVFDAEVPQEWRDDLFRMMEETTNLSWLVLTKRPENIESMTPARWMGDLYQVWPANVWIGTTVENQKAANERIPHLIKCKAPVQFLSCEPMTGPVDIHAAFPSCGRCKGTGEILFKGHAVTCTCEYLMDIDWVICGGESGPGARAMDPAWARSLRDQCVRSETAFLFKQWGEWAPGPDGQMTKIGKKKAGRTLDGQVWDQFPDS